jgi:hypothetical protein
LKQAIRAMLSEFASRDASQFVINQWCQLVESVPVTVAPGNEELCYVAVSDDFMVQTSLGTVSIRPLAY